jgi:protein-S-isoprenylcysteine O-methyltransferase Ste14
MSFARLGFIISCFVWLCFELWLNLRDRGKGERSTGINSGVYLLFLIIIALGICVMFQYSGLPRIQISPDVRFLVGTAVILSGSALRWWAVWSLGSHFCTVVPIRAGQKLVKRGPYRFIRHPAYAGAIVVFLGFGLGLGSWPGLAVMGLLPFLGYRRRIRIEEQFMITSFRNEYRRFMDKTKKLIPFVY